MAAALLYATPSPRPRVPPARPLTLTHERTHPALVPPPPSHPHHTSPANAPARPRATAGGRGRKTRPPPVEASAKTAPPHPRHPRPQGPPSAEAHRTPIGLEAAQILLAHHRAHVTKIEAERDMRRAAAVAGKVG